VKRAADAERALAELGAGRREDRRFRVVLLDEIFQTEQIRPRRGESVVPSESTAPPSSTCGALAASFHAQSPVAASSTSPPGTGLGFEAALFPGLDARIVGGQLNDESRPIEAVVGAHAGVGGDRRLFCSKKRLMADMVFKNQHSAPPAREAKNRTHCTATHCSGAL